MDTPEVFALLDDASPNGWTQARARLYEGYAGQLVCRSGADWPRVLDSVEDALRRGLHAVPVLTYELGEQLLGVAAPGALQAPDVAAPPPLGQVLLFERC